MARCKVVEGLVAGGNCVKAKRISLSVALYLAKGVMTLIDLVKHPTTPYLDISPSQGRAMVRSSDFLGCHVTVTEKMDGEIATIYQDGRYHPRSLTYSSHWSRDVVKQLIPGITPAIKPNEMFVFENMYARHTIAYDDLEDYLYLLYIVRNGMVIGTRETQRIASNNKFATPKVLFSGTLRSISQLRELSGYKEGYVIRWSNPFPYNELHMFTAKYVVDGFIQEGEEHWRSKPPTRNKLRSRQASPEKD